MNIITPSDLPAEPQTPVSYLLPNIVTQGFALARRNWPFILWAYAVNLLFGLLAGIPFANGLAPYLDHSLAAQRLSGTIDVGYLVELLLHLRDAHSFAMMFHLATWLNLLQVLILFLLFTGTVVVYLSPRPPRLMELIRSGGAYFWRFARAVVLAGCVAGIVLGVLLAARGALLSRLSDVYVGGTMSVWTAITGAVVFLAAMLLRLWFDLVEIYVVRNAMAGQPRVRHALRPAYRLLLRHFFRLFGSFLLAGLAGVCVLALCLLIWKALPANWVWPAMLLAQSGLFVMLASRFWQRGIETALVLAADPPVIAVQESTLTAEVEPADSLVGVAGVSGLAEPTLSELVQKLQTQSWAIPPELMPASITGNPRAATDSGPIEKSTATKPKPLETAAIVDAKPTPPAAPQEPKPGAAPAPLADEARPEPKAARPPRQQVVPPSPVDLHDAKVPLRSPVPGQEPAAEPGAEAQDEKRGEPTLPAGNANAPEKPKA